MAGFKKPAPTTGDGGDTFVAGNLPVIRAGSWHTIPPFGNVSSATVPDQREFFVPLWPARRCTLMGVAVNVTLALLGGVVRIGLYRSANGLPTRIVQEFGTVPTGVVGMQVLTGFSVRLESELHFLAVCRQGGVLNLGLSSRDTWDPVISELSPVLGANLNAYYVDGVAGAFADVDAVVAGSVQGPSAAVQLT